MTEFVWSLGGEYKRCMCVHLRVCLVAEQGLGGREDRRRRAEAGEVGEVFMLSDGDSLLRADGSHGKILNWE